MQKAAVTCILLIWMMLPLAPATEDTDDLIFPDPGRKICLVQAEEKTGTMLTGSRLPMDSEFAQKIAQELDLPFHQSVIKLSQCSRNFVTDREGPNILFLSRNEGGFPRQGLILNDGGEAFEFPDLFFVDLVLDEQRLARGDLDIFSHELGHVMMLNIWKNIPDQRSNKQHVSMGVTDYTTAVFEGWGIHFQRLAYDSTPLYLKRYLDNFGYSRSHSRAWHSNVDQDLRINGVLQNIYIHQKLLPDIDTEKMELEELILFEHASPIFDTTRLRNGQQMLSCEGVLATIFYRINTNTKLRQNYREADFYDRFLLRPMPESIEPRELFSPFENVMLKHFWIWSRLDDTMTGESVLPVEYIEEWAASFPEDREEIHRLFVLTTMGKTVSDQLGDIYEQMALFGMQGNIQCYREKSSAFRDEFAPLMEDVLSGKAVLGANVGPQLWVKNEGFLIRRALWDPSNKRAFWINLNTASAYELASFRGLSLEKAKAIVNKREEKGYFRSFEDATACGIKLPSK